MQDKPADTRTAAELEAAGQNRTAPFGGASTVQDVPQGTLTDADRAELEQLRRERVNAPGARDVNGNPIATGGFPASSGPTRDASGTLTNAGAAGARDVNARDANAAGARDVTGNLIGGTGAAGARDATGSSISASASALVRTRRSE